MKGRIVNYRGGVNTHYSNQMIIMPEECESKTDASKLVGKKIYWTTPSGKQIVGKIRKPHGGKGAVLVKFNKGLPGQALGGEVDISATD